MLMSLVPTYLTNKNDGIIHILKGNLGLQTVWYAGELQFRRRLYFLAVELNSEYSLSVVPCMPLVTSAPIFGSQSFFSARRKLVLSWRLSKRPMGMWNFFPCEVTVMAPDTSEFFSS